MVAPAGAEFVLAAFGQQVVVEAAGAQLRCYKASGRDVIVSYPHGAEPPRYAGATLVPWPNRIRDGHYYFAGRSHQLAVSEGEQGTALHGLARRYDWTRTEHAADVLALRAVVGPVAGYPFRIDVRIRYALTPHGLAVDVHAVNRGDSPAPWGYGAHPYLAVADTTVRNSELQLPAARCLVVDDRSLPITTSAVSGRTDFRELRPIADAKLDDSFTELTRDADGRAVVQLRAGGQITRVWADANLPYLQVFAPDEFAPGLRGVAIEPMSCPPDAFNSGHGLVVLECGDSWSASWGIEP